MKRIQARIVASLNENPESEPDQDPAPGLLKQLEEDILDWETVWLDFRSSQHVGISTNSDELLPDRVRVRSCVQRRRWRLN